MVVPNFVNITYQLQLYCDYIEQINDINEMFLDNEGRAWGIEYKFMASQESLELNTSVPSDGDRINTSTIRLNVKAGLISKDIDMTPSTARNVTSYNIKFGTRVINDMNEINGIQ